MLYPGYVQPGDAPPTPPEVLAAEGRFQGGLWLLAEVDLSRIDTRPVRLSVSLPANLVQRIKAWEIEHQMIQSGLLALGACRTWGVASEKRPQRGQFLPDLQAHSATMGQKAGVLGERRSQKWTAAAKLQPTFPSPTGS